MTTIARKINSADRIMNDVGGVSYARDFQPTYTDKAALGQALDTIIDTVPRVTSPERIQALSDQLALIALGVDNRSVLITGNCAERVDDPELAAGVTREAITEIDLVRGGSLDGQFLHIRRDRGQNAKPRSEATEMVDSRTVVSYMGDAINGKAPDEREPDPERLVAAARQASMLEQNLTAHYDEHIPAAHEALHLHYERAHLHDEVDGARYLLSTDMPWIGMRTNSPDSKQVELLAEVENPVGVKLGPGTSAEQVAELSRRLNPARRLGKIAWMLRAGLDRPEETRAIIEAILESDENPIIMYDIHGSTVKREDGAKIRALERIRAEIAQLHEMCQANGTRLHGLHLETTMQERLECVETVRDTPTHEGGIDPQLNRVQTAHILQDYVDLTQR